MRVTDAMVWSRMQRSVASRQTDYATAQQRASTGKRVAAPSDDPAAFAQARSETGDLARAQNYEKTIGLAKPVLETTESSLYEVENVYSRIREIAVQGANDTMTPSDRNTLSEELDGLRAQLVTIGNATSGDRYIFAGYKEAAPPYDAAGVYSGDPLVQQVEVSRGVKMPLGVTGEAVFGTTGADIFTTITNLQTALSSNNGGTISATLTEIDVRFENVRAVHSQLGNAMNAADIAESLATRAQDTATAKRSALVDIDAAESYTDLARAQTALQAAIEIASQLPMPGLASRSR